MFRTWGYFLIAVFAALILAALSILPPSSVSSSAPPDQFSSGRAMDDVRIISGKPHPTGSAENKVVRDYIEQRLLELGLDVSISASELAAPALDKMNRWSGQNKPSQTIYNIIGILPGSDRTAPAVLLMAHHDTVIGSPGAADDTIGVASILEMSRILKDVPNRQRDLIVLFTDAEELGLHGAADFFENHPLRKRVGVILNFEARGGGGTVNLFQTSRGNGEAARMFARNVTHPGASSLAVYIYSVMQNDTDLTMALGKGYTAYNFANIGQAGYYHSPKITPDALEEGSLQHMGSQGLDLTRALLTADALPAKSSNATFFDVFGFFTLIFAPAWGWGFLAVAAVLFGLSVRSQKFSKPRLLELLMGAVKMLAVLIIGGGIIYGLNMVSDIPVKHRYYDRLAAIPKLEIMAALVCLSAGLLVFGRKALSAFGRLGAALPLLALAVAAQIYAPTAAYILTLPLMLIALGSVDSLRWLRIPIAALVAGFMLSLAHLLMLGVGPDLPSAAVLPFAIGFAALLPLYPGLKRRAAYGAASLGLIAAAGMALYIRLDPIASTVPTW